MILILSRNIHFCFFIFIALFLQLLICLATNNNNPIAILKLIIDEPPKLINGRGTPVRGIVADIPPKFTNV